LPLLLLAIAAVAVTACTSDTASSSGHQTQPLDLFAGVPGHSASPPAIVQGPLPPGTYVTSVFSPTMTMTLGAGWTLESEGPGYLVLDIPSTQQTIDFIRLDQGRVFHPVLGVDQEDPSRQYATQPAPADYFEYLRSTGYVQLSSPQPTVVGGLSSSSAVGVVTLPGQPGTCRVYRSDPGPCLLLMGVATPPPLKVFEVGPGQVEWVLVPTRPGPVLVSIVAGPPRDAAALDAFLPQADALLGTLKFASSP
jgi:hypothetical protein